MVLGEGGVGLLEVGNWSVVVAIAKRGVALNFAFVLVAGAGVLMVVNGERAQGISVHEVWALCRNDSRFGGGEVCANSVPMYTYLTMGIFRSFDTNV
jgi:hypothetical protein